MRGCLFMRLDGMEEYVKMMRLYMKTCTIKSAKNQAPGMTTTEAKPNYSGLGFRVKS